MPYVMTPLSSTLSENDVKDVGVKGTHTYFCSDSHGSEGRLQAGVWPGAAV